MLKEIFDIVEKKERPTLSKLIYLLTGMIMLTEIFLKIAPFKISIPFLENLVLVNHIEGNSPAVIILFWVWVIYISSLVLRKVILRCYSNVSDDEFGKICIIVYSICDVLDFIASVLSFAFIIFIAVQIYKTNIVLLTGKVIFIYVMIMFQFFDFIIFRIYHKNKKIVWNSLKH